MWLFDVILWYSVIEILDSYYVITGSHAHDTDLMIQELRMMLCVTLHVKRARSAIVTLEEILHR